MKTVYLSLGSNEGDRQRHLQRAIDLMDASDLRITRVSPVYETEPQGVAGQRWFFNVVVELQTLLFPPQLLSRTQEIEKQLKRNRDRANGPRTIDIDIVLFGDAVMKTEELQIPHPRYALRRFVLQPLADLSPDLRDPANHCRVSELLAGLEGQPVRLAPKAILKVPQRVDSPPKASS